MKNELFTIGPLTIHGYGFMIACGVIAAYIYLDMVKKMKISLKKNFLIGLC